jgi:hypothetical protein
LGWKADNEFNFDNESIKPLMKQFKLSPWSAVADLKHTRKRVQALVHGHHLSKIDVEMAKKHYEKSIGGWLPQHRLSRSLFLTETNKLVHSEGKFLSARDYDILDDVFSLLDVDKSEELEAPEWALGLFLIFAGEPKKKLQMAFEMIDRDNDGNISQKEIHRFLLPYMNVMVPEGAEVLRPLLAWHCAEECMKDVAQYLQQDKVEELPLEKLVSFSESHDIVLEAAARIDKKVYNMWLDLEHESAFYARKDARKQAGMVGHTMSEFPIARRRSRQDSNLFLEAVTGSTDVATVSCASASVSMQPTPPEVHEGPNLLRSSPEIQTNPEAWTNDDQSEAGPPPPPPLPPAPNVMRKLVEEPRRHAVTDTPRGSIVRLQVPGPTAFALRSQPCRVSTRMQMSPRVVSASAPLWSHGSSTIVQYSSAASQVHAVVSSSRLLSKMSSHVCAANVSSPSREVSLQSTPRGVSMQSCKSTTSVPTPLPILLGSDRYQPEPKK